VRKKGGVGLFFFLPIFTYFWKVMIVMMMMIKDDGWQISFFLLILDLFFDFLTDFFLMIVMTMSYERFWIFLISFFSIL